MSTHNEVVSCKDIACLQPQYEIMGGNLRVDNFNGQFAGKLSTLL